MIEAIFTRAVNSVTVTGLTQWDYGRELSIKGLDLPEVVQVHFGNSLTEKATVRLSHKEGDDTIVEIPDKLLRSNRDVIAWIYEADPSNGETLKTIHLPIIARAEPDEFMDPPDPDDSRLIIEFISTINSKTTEMLDILKSNVEENKTFQSTMAQKFKTYYDDLKAETIKRTVSGVEVFIHPSNWTADRYTVDISQNHWSDKSRIFPIYPANDTNAENSELIIGYETDGSTFSFIAEEIPTVPILVTLGYFGEQTDPTRYYMNGSNYMKQENGLTYKFVNREWVIV